MSQSIRISADSTCDLGPALVEKYQIRILPLHVNLEDKSFFDGVDIQPDDIYQTYHEKKILPKNAAGSIGEYTDLFTELTADGSAVIHFSIGSSLSASNNNARLAAEDFENVYVIDTQNLSTGSGLLVLAAHDRMTAGMPAAQIAEEVAALVANSHASFVIDTLEFLHKGGRCSALAMLGANMLQLKPCIAVDNQAGGKMGVAKKYRGSLDKALEMYVKDQLADRTDLDLKRVFITHSGISEERIAAVKALIAQYANFEEILVTRAGCTVSSHCGPNTLGVLFMTV